MSDIFSVLADPTRRTILEALAQKSQSVSELVALTGEGQPTISKHLKTLRDAGLVSVQAAGQARVYSLDAAPLAEVELFLAKLGMADAVTAKAGKAKSATITAEADLSAIMGSVGEKVGEWISLGANWLGDQIAEKLADNNINPETLGKEVGRKLADAKLSATDVAADTEAQVRAEIAQLSEKLGSAVSDFKSTGLQNLVAKAKLAKANQASHNED
jgi:DNA-binding transcriptional ArsR family regulator